MHLSRNNVTTLTAAVVLVSGCSEHPTLSEPLDVPPPQLNIRAEPGRDSPGPPFYSLLQPGWFPMTDEWAAVVWIRETACVPADFNILDLDDLTILVPPAVPSPGPRPFFCPLTIEGHEIWNTDPPDPRVGPLNVVLQGLGAVPIWFVSTEDLLPVICPGSTASTCSPTSGAVLTIADLEQMNSLLIGYADHFTLTQQLGAARGRPGEGKINIAARGTLTDSRTFFFQTAEGPPGKLPIAHTRIEFR